MLFTAGFPRRVLASLVAALAVGTGTICAYASDLPNKTFVYKAESRKLSELLQDFAASLSIPVIVADGVEGTVNGKFNLSPSSFLDLMSSAYGLSWYFDGNVLFVYPARANQSKVIFLREFGVERIERLLQSLKLGDKRFPLRYDATEKTLVVSGPPRHLELVDSLVEVIAAKGREDGSRVVRVFPLRFAASSDQTIGGATVTGMVSMLNRVYGNKADSAGASASTDPLSGPTQMSPMALMYGTNPASDNLRAKAAERADRAMGNAANAFSLGSGAATPTAKPVNAAGPSPMDEERPMFTSDDANNAVIVMGLPSRMALYADLIKQLDVAADLIELEATIIDVRHDDVVSIGVNWTAKGRSTEASYSPVGTLAAAAGSVFQLTTLSADLSKQLLLTVNALQQQGRAKIVARPRVVGIANRLATMKDTRKASIRVAGNLSSNLYSLETGTQIEVIPRKVFVEGISAIKLALSIQDGSFDSTVVDAIPIIKQTGISTEAYVAEGEGLLIGGISTESESTGQSGLPGLSSIPLFGALFRSNDDQATRRERLFLITPRIISLARRATPQAEHAVRPTEGVVKASMGLSSGLGVSRSDPKLTSDLPDARDNRATRKK